MSNLSILMDIINLADEFVENNRDEEDDLGTRPECREETGAFIEGSTFIEKLVEYFFDLSEAERLYVATVMFGGKSATSKNKPNFEKIYSEMLNAKQSLVFKNLRTIQPYNYSLFLRAGIKAFKIKEVRLNTYLE